MKKFLLTLPVLAATASLIAFSAVSAQASGSPSANGNVEIPGNGNTEPTEGTTIERPTINWSEGGVKVFSDPNAVREAFGRVQIEDVPLTDAKRQEMEKLRTDIRGEIAKRAKERKMAPAQYEALLQQDIDRSTDAYAALPQSEKDSFLDKGEDSDVFKTKLAPVEKQINAHGFFGAEFEGNTEAYKTITDDRVAIELNTYTDNGEGNPDFGDTEPTNNQEPETGTNNGPALR